MKIQALPSLALSTLLLTIPLANGVAAEQDAKKEAAAVKERVNKDIAASKDPSAKISQLFAYYVVPPMSNIKRTQFQYPEDGVLGGPIRIIAAKGEFEPASVVFFPFADAKKVEVKVSDLKGKNGTIPSSAIDLKIIKVWYQTGTAWYSYFSDSKGRELVPELLLNDETLIKVDTKTEDNFLRVGAADSKDSKYIWISNPHEIQIPFNDTLEPVGDAPKFQPFSFQAGELKQLWLTFEAPKGAEGLYTGSLAITVDGKPQGNIPLEVRVLPFELPDPMTNYDLNKIFYASIYNNIDLKEYLKKNGGDMALALKRIQNEYANLKKHNLLYPQIPNVKGPQDRETFLAQFDLYKKAGLHTDALFGGVSALPPYHWMTSPQVRGVPLEEQPPPLDLYKAMDYGSKVVSEAVGHKNIYAFGWDEPGMKMLVAERLPWKYLHEKGLKTFSTAHHSHLQYAGYNEDFANYGGSYPKEDAEIWHGMGARITSYATPHTGPENPDFARRTHGFDLYKANFDGPNNYILDGSPWNDFADAEINFRAFNMIYPGKEAPIDTIQWEGFREGIDDVRYATLLKQLANKAIATGKTDNIYAGRQALLWLGLQDSKTCDLNTLRLEMINKILELKKIL